ncbi:MAG TPA: metalloregulator ArsR/SmtB family transcription factor [Burkholderiaceae bacterium]|nr:metalloregulator ArsR/SmtB family transcription factor [Burkholderiaceae bacterium]
MVKFENESLDLIFAALSDSTRRDVLDALGRGSSTVTELAQPHGMSLPGFMKHLRVLEDAGLVVRSKEGRVVRCALSAQPMQEAAMWMSRYEKFWTERLDALGRYLYHQEEIKAWKKAPPKTSPRSSSIAPTPSAPKKSGTRGPTRKR